MNKQVFIIPNRCLDAYEEKENKYNSMYVSGKGKMTNLSIPEIF